MIHHDAFKHPERRANSNQSHTYEVTFEIGHFVTKERHPVIIPEEMTAPA